MDLILMLQNMVKNIGSDLHIRAGAPPLLRIDGVLKPVEHPAITRQETDEIFNALLTDIKERFCREFSLDMAHVIENFRASGSMFFSSGAALPLPSGILYQMFPP